MISGYTQRCVGKSIKLRGLFDLSLETPNAPIADWIGETGAT